MYNIPVNATNEQIEMIEKYIENKDINLSQELLKKAIELIQDYEDSLVLEKAIEESDGNFINHNDFWEQAGL